MASQEIRELTQEEKDEVYSYMLEQCGNGGEETAKRFFSIMLGDKELSLSTLELAEKNVELGLSGLQCWILDG